MIISVEHLMGIILANLKYRAEVANQGAPVADAVVSIPAYFTDEQRRSMLDACQIADLSCIRLMHETTAVALSYGIYRSASFDAVQPQHVLFIDMGHSNYSITIAAFLQSKLQIKSCVYDRHLGGRDFDRIISDWICAEFQRKTGLDASGNIKAMLKIEQAAEKAKKTLSPSGVNEANVSVECLMNDIDFSGTLTRDVFEATCQPLLDRLEAPIQQALLEAGITREQLIDVEIVGGATRVSCLKNRLSDIFGLDKSKPNYGLSTTLNADESVAKGCALQSAILSPRFRVKEFEVVEAITYAIKLNWEPTELTSSEANQDGEEVEEQAVNENQVILFKRNDASPKSLQITLRKAADFVVVAEYDYFGSSRKLSEFHFSGVTSPTEGPKTRPRKIRLQFKLDLHGLLSVSSAQMIEEINDEEENNEKMQTDTTEQTQNDQKQTEQESNNKKRSETGMDVDENQGAQKEQKKKKKIRKVTLNVNSILTGFSKTELNEIIEREAHMANQDRIIRETAHKRNELEAYVYAMRDNIVGELRDFVGDRDREAFSNKLQAAEDWLYTDGYDATKSMYERYLTDLMALGEPIQTRKFEYENRPPAIAELTKHIEDFLIFCNSSEDRYAHITSQERDTVRNSVISAQKWLYEQLSKIGNAPLYSDPAVTIAHIREKINLITKVGNPIMYKPKPPAPAPTPSPKTEEQPQQQAEQTNQQQTNEEMDTNVDQKSTEQPQAKP
jgi:heat shock protein 4